MNEHEIERIAAAMHELRPDWPAKSLRTLIAKHLADKPRRDVAVALAWIACESGTATPARVLETGPWWRAVAVEATRSAVEKFDPATTCVVCGKREERCRANPHADHEFQAVAAAWKLRGEPESSGADKVRAVLRGETA